MNKLILMIFLPFFASASCNITVSNTSDWEINLRQAIQNQSNSVEGRTVCLESGIYEKNIQTMSNNGQSVFQIPGANNVTLQGIGTVTFRLSGATTTENTNSVFRIDTSSKFTVKDIRVENNVDYYSTPAPAEQKTAKSFEINNSSNIVLLNVIAKSTGKGTIYVDHNSSAQIESSTVQCYYFCVISRNNSTATSNFSNFTLHNTKYAHEEHSMFYTENGDLIFNYSTFLFENGKGFASGTSTDQSKSIILVSPKFDKIDKMQGLALLHENYKNLRVFITSDTYTPNNNGIGLQAYICEKWNFSNCNTSMTTRNYLGTHVYWRANTSSSFTYIN